MQYFGKSDAIYSVQETIMIDEGLVIMGVGMLVVFAFLTIMVLSMGLMSRLILTIFPERDEPIHVPKKRGPAPVPSAHPVVQAPVADSAEIAVSVAVAYALSPWKIEPVEKIPGTELAIAIAAAHSL